MNIFLKEFTGGTLRKIEERKKKAGKNPKMLKSKNGRNVYDFHLEKNLINYFLTCRKNPVGNFQGSLFLKRNSPFCSSITEEMKKSNLLIRDFLIGEV